jgi:hypothetical protein
MVLMDKTDRAPHDLTQVGLAEEWEVRYWCNRFGTTESELRACVAEVGPRTEAVEARMNRAAKQVLKNTGED